MGNRPSNMELFKNDSFDFLDDGDRVDVPVGTIPKAESLEPPAYDSELLVTAFPNLTQMKFNQDDRSGVIVVTLVSRGGGRQDVEIGTELPKSTKDLVIAISRTIEVIDRSALNEVEGLFEGIE